MPLEAPQIDTLGPDQAKAFRRSLLAWYRRERRDLPWRAMNGRATNPYHIMVSEAMLQQTQVATVVPYFHRFIDSFPTIQALADAEEQQVLTHWQGLGYYRRARHLHLAAKAVVDKHACVVPKTTKALRQLPGVGQYTAGAIASIAHGTRAAVVDGNVERVLARLLLIEEPINAPPTKKQLWAIAEPLVPRSNPGDYNQALMELGARVCTPKTPKCFVCPVRMQCRAVQEDNPERLPVKLAKKKPTNVTHMVFAVRRNNRFLFEQRPAGGLWPNMWQLPTWEQPMNETRHPISRDIKVLQSGLLDWFRQRFGLSSSTPAPLTQFTHQTTHRTIQFVVYQATAQNGRLTPKAGVWRSLAQLEGMPMSNPQRQTVNLLADQ